MAPLCPDEVDVFTVPHSRMKKLVNKYKNMIMSTDFGDEEHFKMLLENLVNVFSEFKAHEQIENSFIMKRLKSKLRAASVNSAAVCNCHNDNRLTDMLDLVLGGYKWTQHTERERRLYGQKLVDALDDFTMNFIPHMEEEEKVFQPLLMKYFSYEELKELKAKVIHEHIISKSQEDLSHEKFVEDIQQSEESTTESPECYFDKLPNEICLQIFSYLGPRDLARVGGVSQRWYQLTRDPALWPQLSLVQWAKGEWSFKSELQGGVDGPGFLTELGESGCYDCDDRHGPYEDTDVDEDADVDESGESDMADLPEEEAPKQILKEAKMITAIVKYLLPHVGSGVKVCDLAHSRGISNNLVHKILKLCPNLEELDLTHTQIGDTAFKEYAQSNGFSRLRHLDLTGCQNVTDLTLLSLAASSQQDFDPLTQDREMDIENVPLPCAYKQGACCGGVLLEKKLSADSKRNSLGGDPDGRNRGRCRSSAEWTANNSNNSDGKKEQGQLQLLEGPELGLEVVGDAMNCVQEYKNGVRMSAAATSESRMSVPPKSVCCREKRGVEEKCPELFEISTCLQIDNQTLCFSEAAVARLALSESLSPNLSESSFCRGDSARWSEIDEWDTLRLRQVDWSSDCQDSDSSGRPDEEAHNTDSCDESHLEERAEGSVKEGLGDRYVSRSQGEKGARARYSGQGEEGSGAGCCGQGKGGLGGGCRSQEEEDDGAEYCDQGEEGDGAGCCGQGEEGGGVGCCGQGEVGGGAGCCGQGEEGGGAGCCGQGEKGGGAGCCGQGEEGGGAGCCGQEKKDDVTQFCDQGEERETMGPGGSQGQTGDSQSRLEYLSLNGCYMITDEGISALAQAGGLPHLRHLDLSGCVQVTGEALSDLVDTSRALDLADLFYCNNLYNDPYPTTASGCRNLQCGSRFCCSMGQ